MRRDLRIGLLVPSFATKGEFEVPAVRLLAEQLSMSLDLHVFPVRYPPVAGWQRWNDLQLHSVGSDGQPFRRVLWRSLARLRTEHRRKQFDLLHALWLFEPGFIAMVAGKLLRVPVVASVGGAEIADIPDIGYGGARSRRGRMMASGVVRGVSHVTGGSTYVLEQTYRFGVDAQRSSRIPLPVDVDLFSPASDDRDGRQGTSVPRLLHVGSFVPVKDHVMLLRAFRRVLVRFPKAQLTLIGEDPFGYRALVEQESVRLGVHGRVVFRNRVAHGRLVEHYRNADIFVFPSRHESQGIAPLEALASGVPVVGTDVGVVRDLDGVGTVAVPVRDDAALAAACVELLESRSRAAVLARRGAETVHAQFSPEFVSCRFLALYRRLLSNGAP